MFFLPDFSSHQSEIKEPLWTTKPEICINGLLVSPFLRLGPGVDFGLSACPLIQVTRPTEGHFSWGHFSKVSLCPCLTPQAQATISLGRQSGCSEEKIWSIKLIAFLCLSKADLGKMPKRTRHIYRVLFDLLLNAPCRVIQVKWEYRISKEKLKEDSKYKLFVAHKHDLSLLFNIFPLTSIFKGILKLCC